MDIRIWWHVPAQKIYLAALHGPVKEPHVDLDLELELCCLALPDIIEDRMTAELVREILRRYLSFASPLLLELKSVAKTHKVRMLSDAHGMRRSAARAVTV